MPRRNTQKVSHLLAADLRRQILNGQFVADQQLPPEPELIARLQVSRETLREALRILESQQLVEIKRGRGGGAVVRRPGLEAWAGTSRCCCSSARRLWPTSKRPGR